MAQRRAKGSREKESSSEDDSSSIGPALPPNFRRAPSPHSSTSSDGHSSDDNEPAIGSSVPPNSTSDIYGPALPPALLQHQRSRPMVGPSLPPTGSVADYSATTSLSPEVDGSDDDDDDDVIGPRPPPSGHGADYDVALEFEKRAERMKQKLIGNKDDEKPKRAEWMLELPPELNKNFGLGPRSFLRQTPAPKGDRSGWTQTPDSAGDKIAAVAEDAIDKKLVEDKARAAYNKSMNQRTEDINKSSKREKSLMEIHQKNLKRKKKEEPKSHERRPFDRDEDLKVNSFDDARRKALIKKSRQLDDKFSAGKSQFL